MTDSLIDRLRTFAEADETIIALTKGNDPEDDGTRSVVYYFIVNGKFNEERVDRISSLDMEIARGGYDCSLMEWPSREISHYPFLGEVIWRRKQFEKEI